MGGWHVTHFVQMGNIYVISVKLYVVLQKNKTWIMIQYTIVFEHF